MTQQVDNPPQGTAATQISEAQGRRPRILYVCPRMPYPLDNGGNIRILNLVKYMNRVATVDMLCFASEPPSVEHLQILERHCNAVRFVRSGRRTPARMLAAAVGSLFKGAPMLALLDYHRQVADELACLIRDGGYDFVYYDYLHTGEYLLNHPAGPKAICGFHNVESEIWRRKALHSSSRLTGALLHWQARVMERYERRVLAQADMCTTVCDRDTEQVASWGTARQTPVQTLDIGIDFENLDGLVQAPVEPSSLVFVGSMDWQPNQDAVAGLLTRNFLDFLRKSSLRFRVVGRAMSPELREMQSDVVELLGNVPALAPIYSQALAMVVPLRIAGGTRVKIREAMAYGVPVISTSVGAEGIKYTDGKDILIADDLPGTIRAVERLQDRTIRQNIISQALKLVRSEYDAKVIADRFVDSLRQLMPAGVAP